MNVYNFIINEDETKDRSLGNPCGNGLHIGFETRQKEHFVDGNEGMKKTKIHCSNGPEIPIALRLNMSPLCQTRSNALLMSQNTALISLPESIACERKVMGIMSIGLLCYHQEQNQIVDETIFYCHAEN